MRRPFLHHLQHGVQDTGDGAEGRGAATAEPPLPVEMPEQLVGAVDEVDDHEG